MAQLTLGRGTCCSTHLARRGRPRVARRGPQPCASGPSPPDAQGRDASAPQPSTSGSGPQPSLTDPVQTIAWGGTLPSPRRAVLGGLSGLAIALGGNLGGCTSWLLGLDGGRTAAALRADVLVPVRGARRCVDYNYGFEFTYPSSWLGDQTLLYRAAQRAEAERGGLPGDPLDYYPPAGSSSRAASGRRSSRPSVVEPVAAFGPAGTTGEENVSVIVAPILPGFELASLGDPQSAARQFLATLAPEGSGLIATLISASARTMPAPQQQPGQQQQQLYYTLEYTVQGPKFFRHNVSVYTARRDQLYTFNAQCPEARWAEDGAALRASAESFTLF